MQQITKAHPFGELLDSAQDGAMVLSMEGEMLCANQRAADILSCDADHLLNKPVMQSLNLARPQQKRQLVKAVQYFKQAKSGVAQQFDWVEYESGKPCFAYTILMNKTTLRDDAVMLVQFKDIMQEKIMEWTLWSLAQITNQDEITGVIDAILELISAIFHVDYASVCLIDKKGLAHTVSYYENGERRSNLTFHLADSPSNMVLLKKSILYFSDAQEEFPQDKLLKHWNVRFYLGGPICNAQKEVVGLISMRSKEVVELTKVYQTIFHLFLNRVNLEIDRLLSQRKLQFLASIPQQDPNPVIRILPTGSVIFANTQGKHLLAYWKNMHSGLPDPLLEQAMLAQEKNKIMRTELEAENKVYLFTLVWIEEFKQINIYGTDITQLKSAQQDIRHLAHNDYLTQIANRQCYEEHIVKKIAEHRLKESKLALLLIDLDNFKIINDTLGHAVGDKLLKSTTRRMLHCIRHDDFLARLGGDEFVIILSDSDSAAASMVAEKIISLFGKMFHFGEYHMKITASIGIALYPESGQTPGDLLKHADIAMYQAKKEGKNLYCIFSKTQHYIQNKRLEIIKKELKLAVAKKELYVSYQPQIHLQSNQIVGIEALLRWNHPKEGLIFPSEFIQQAEQTGCINLISQWLIKRALQDYKALINDDFNPLLSINVSLVQLSNPQFVESLDSMLTKLRIEKDRIIIDISEQSVAHYFEQIIKNINEFHDIGTKVCLDNFGSPQVSLPKLLALPFDCIKLTHQLLKNIERKNKHYALLKGIIDLTRGLEIKTIQKGVETLEQHVALKTMGCEYGQGYFYCKPIPFEELERFIHSNYSSGW